MKKLSIFTLFYFTFNIILAQEKSPYLMRSTLSAAASSQSINHNQKDYLLQQSYGQSSPAGTVYQNEFVARQGFIQPFILLRLAKEPDFIGLGIYPNPVIDELHIDLDQPYEGNLYLNLYDYRGRLVAKQKYVSQQNIVFDVRHFAQGTYFLKVVLGNKQKVAQINKLR